jgi:molybdopterin-guanine dinucleotide biosynthesis protein A
MGQPKAWLPIGGEPMLTRMVQVVPPPVVVVAAVGQALPSLPAAVSVVRDSQPDCGPLEGLLAGLQASRGEWVFVTACDVPLLSPAFIQWLHHQAIEAKREAVVPMVEGRSQPLTAIYHRRVVHVVQDLRQAGRRAMRDLLAAIPIQHVDATPFAACLQNINTPEEYAVVRQTLN